MDRQREKGMHTVVGLVLPIMAMVISCTMRSADVSELKLWQVSLTVADPKGFPWEVLLELHPWRTAWPLGHVHVGF